MKVVFIFLGSLLILIGNFSTNCQAQDSGLYNQAELLFQRYEYFKAIDKINEFLKSSPKNVAALKLRADCYAKTGNDVAAIKDLELVVKIDNDNVTCNMLLGKLYGKRGDWARAVTILEHNQSLKKVPQKNQYYLVYYKILNGNGEQAMDFISKYFANVKNQNDPLFWYLQGLAIDSIHRGADSDIKYTVAISRLPSFSEFNEKYGELAELFPYINFFIVRADRLFNDSIYDQAATIYKRVLEVDSNNYDCIFKIGYCLYKTDKIAESEIYFKQCKNVSLYKSEVYFYLGHIEYLRRNWTQALEYFKVGIELKSTNPRLFIYAGHCAFEMVKYSEAQNFYKKAFLVTTADSISEAEWLILNDKSKEVEEYIWHHNIEYNPPQLVILRPLSAKKDKLSWNRGGVRRVEFTIKDESAIKFVKVNSDTLKTDTTIVDQIFVYDFKQAVAEGVFVFMDVYGNENTATFKLQTNDSMRIEFNSPPFNSKYEIVPDDPFAEMLVVSGLINTEMPLISININGNDYELDSMNIDPGFSVSVPMKELTDSLRITILDQDKNAFSYSYYLNLIQAQMNASNTIMGKTWFVFIENSDYENLNSLPGPSRDFKKIETALIDYKIDELFHKKNLTKEGFDEFFLGELLPKIRKSNVRSLVLWYAGHGYRDGEDAYWIPVNGKKNALQTWYSSDALMHALKKLSVNHLLVVTDACQAGASVRNVRSVEEEKICDTQNMKIKSAQILTSSSDGNSDDKSEFAGYFANILETERANCISVETIAKKMKDHFKNGIQEPQFGTIKGLDDYEGTFFFLKK